MRRLKSLALGAAVALITVVLTGCDRGAKPEARKAAEAREQQQHPGRMPRRQFN